MSEVIAKPWPTSERHAPHLFNDEVSVSAGKSPSGRKQIDRICPVCGVVKVTVFGEGGSAWREWRLSPDGTQMKLDVPPACKIVVAAP